MNEYRDDAAAVRALLAARPNKDVSLEERRQGLEALTGRFPLPQTVSVDISEVGGVPARRFMPAGAPSEAVILYFHGGAYSIGSSLSHAELTARLAEAAGLTVFSLDYRRAPEDPFPAAPSDCLAAYQGVLDAGFKAGKIALAGDSAGGCLVLATLLQIRERGLDLPAAGACISPWIDLTHSGGSFRDRAPRDPFLKPEMLEFSATLYLDGASRKDPLASPLFADLSGLPPLLLQVGSEEILFDDAARLAEAAHNVGVQVELEAWEDMFHVWHMFGPMLADGLKATTRMGEFLRDRLAGSG